MNKSCRKCQGVTSHISMRHGARMQCSTVYCSVLQRVAVAARCSMLQYDQCVVVYDSALQLVAVCCRADQAVARQVCVAAHCNILQHTATPADVAHYLAPTFQMFSSLLQHAATQYNTLQHNTTRCNTIQHTATPVD